MDARNSVVTMSSVVGFFVVGALLIAMLLGMELHTQKSFRVKHVVFSWEQESHTIPCTLTEYTEQSRIFLQLHSRRLRQENSHSLSDSSRATIGEGYSMSLEVLSGMLEVPTGVGNKAVKISPDMLSVTVSVIAQL